jgi:iron complex transport system permease protein
MILTEVRLPRALTGACVGALLGVSGAILQGLLRNPLAEPYLLGVSSGAALAVTAAVLLGMPSFILGFYAMPLVAFAGAILALAAVYSLAHTRGRLQVTTLILAGVVVSAFLSAVAMLFAFLSGPRYLEILAWLMGRLEPLTPSAIRWTATVTVAGIALAWAQARDLNALILGEEVAESLGVPVESAKRWLFVLASLLTGAAVAAAGPIGFVGLVAPHICRLLLGPDHRVLIPASALAGSVVVLCSDAVARVVVAPSELPAGVVTSLLGGPFFLVLLVRQARLSGRGR